MTTWHKGPPPSIGWWPASWNRNPRILRYYNGEWWSIVVSCYMTAKEAGERAREKEPWQKDIEWTDRPASWPERSRT
jgi:hypothetical protein